MKYLVIGAGGTGGLIGGYLAKKQFDVTIVARGEHLRVIRQKGLTIKTYGEEPVHLTNIKAIGEDALENQKFDVIFVCVKAYHLSSIVQMLKNAAHKQTVIIPILNSLGAGRYLRTALPGINIYDGCIYITGFISAPGEVSQNNQIFRIFYGLDKENKTDNSRDTMESEVRESGIDIRYSAAITSEIFKKLTFTSAFASCAAYHNIQASSLQSDETYRNHFISLLKELKQISDAANFGLTDKFFKENLQIMDDLSADFTASFQKDLQQNKPDERNEIIHDIVRLAARYSIQIPHYEKLAKHFK